jgi:hypothetical protein
MSEASEADRLAELRRRAEDGARRRAVAHAMRAALLAIEKRQSSIEAVFAALVDQVADKMGATPRENAAAVAQERKRCMLERLAQFEREGRGRYSPMLVASEFCRDERDTIEVASLARKIRRWRREAQLGQ